MRSAPITVTLLWLSSALGQFALDPNCCPDVAALKSAPLANSTIYYAPDFCNGAINATLRFYWYFAPPGPHPHPATQQQVDDFLATVTDDDVSNAYSYTTDGQQIYQCFYPNYNVEWLFGPGAPQDDITSAIEQFTPREYTVHSCPTTKELMVACEDPPRILPYIPKGGLLFNLSTLDPKNVENYVPANATVVDEYCGEAAEFVTVPELTLSNNACTNTSHRYCLQLACSYLANELGWFHPVMANSG
jgi:hypothetical protein